MHRAAGQWMHPGTITFASRAILRHSRREQIGRSRSKSTRFASRLRFPNTRRDADSHAKQRKKLISSSTESRKAFVSSVKDFSSYDDNFAIRVEIIRKPLGQIERSLSLSTSWIGICQNGAESRFLTCACASGRLLTSRIEAIDDGVETRVERSSRSRESGA